MAHSRGYTLGNATYLSLVCAFSDADPPDLPVPRRLLSRMRRDARPFPERVFIPILRALGRAGLPLTALHLFDCLLPAFCCSPSVRSLNSALAALLSSPCSPASLVLSFLSFALRRHPSLSPNLLTFNLLLKALCRSGALEHALTSSVIATSTPLKASASTFLSPSAPTSTPTPPSSTPSLTPAASTTPSPYSTKCNSTASPPPPSPSTPSYVPSAAPTISLALPSSPATCSSRAVPRPWPPTTLS